MYIFENLGTRSKNLHCCTWYTGIDLACAHALAHRPGLERGAYAEGFPKSLNERSAIRDPRSTAVFSSSLADTWTVQSKRPWPRLASSASGCWTIHYGTRGERNASKSLLGRENTTYTRDFRCVAVFPRSSMDTFGLQSRIGSKLYYCNVLAWPRRLLERANLINFTK